MKKIFFLSLAILLGLYAFLVLPRAGNAQAPSAAPAPIPGGRGERWATFGGDQQRTGFQRFDRFFTPESAKNFQLIWKLKIAKGTDNFITQPVVTDPVITVPGFRDIAVVADSADNVYGVDIDLGKVIWSRHLDVPTPQVNRANASCPGGLTANLTFSPPLVFGRRGPAGTPPPLPGTPAAQAARGPAPAPAFGNNQSVFILASNGSLHALAITDGYEAAPGISFLPAAGGKANSLNIAANVMYTATSNTCARLPNAIWAVSLAGGEHTVANFDPGATGEWGEGGVSIASDGTIYAQAGDGTYDPNTGKFGNTVFALTPKDLKLKDYFSFASEPAAGKKSAAQNITPSIFQLSGRSYVATAGDDGRLVLLDSSSLGGADHKTAAFRTPVLVAKSTNETRGVSGGLATWDDASGTRWVLVPLRGPASSGLKYPVTNGETTHGFIAAFKVEGGNGQSMALTPAWTSRDIADPKSVIVIHGVVFALSGGGSDSHAVLYALDPVTGKELHSSGTNIGSGSRGGLTAANGFVYVAGNDGVLYCFGIPMEH